MLAAFPKAGIKKIGIKNKSVFIYTTRKSYLIIYRIKNKEIEILRVLTKYQDLFAVL